MNREQKRDYIRKLRKKGKSDEEIKKLIAFQELRPTTDSFKEGDRVKIDVDRITSNVNYKKMNPKYKKYVESNKNVIFTVEYDEKHPNHKFVCLKEDITEPKWLWWEGDLIKVKL